MHLRVMTKKRLLVDAEVAAVTLPCCAGERTVLPGHDLLLTELVPGVVAYRTAEEPERRHALEVRMGCAEVTHAAVQVFVTAGKAIDAHEGG